MGALRRIWERFEPMQKAVIFKLMEPRAAMRLYRKLPFAEKYFLLGAFDPGSIAPLVEDMPPRRRSLFHRLPQECYKKMSDELGRSPADPKS